MVMNLGYVNQGGRAAEPVPSGDPLDNRPMPSPQYRRFASVSEPNTKFQVKYGSDAENPVLMTVDGPRFPPYRVGDKWAEFLDGLCVTDDPDVIAFCERHPDVIDLDKADAELLVAMARVQTETANYEPESQADMVTLAKKAIDMAVEQRVQEELRKRGLLGELGEEEKE